MPEALSEPLQCRRPDSFKHQEKQQIRDEDGNKAIDDSADCEGLSPKQCIHCSLGDVLQLIDDDGRLKEEGSGSDIHVEDDRPDEGKSASADQSGDEASAAQTREETSQDTPQAERWIKIAGQTDGKTSGSLLAGSAQTKKPDRLVKQYVSNPVSAP